MEFEAQDIDALALQAQDFLYVARPGVLPLDDDDVDRFSRTKAVLVARDSSLVGVNRFACDVASALGWLSFHAEDGSTIGVNIQAVREARLVPCFLHDATEFVFHDALMSSPLTRKVTVRGNCVAEFERFRELAGSRM